jgi:hypothetical protein
MTIMDRPPSPCVKICVVDPLSGLCIGCGRTLAEIAAWGELDADAQRAVLATLGPRLAAARSRSARGRRVGRGRT